MIKLVPKYVRVLQAMAAVAAIGSALYTFVFKHDTPEPPVAAKSCFLQFTIEN